MTQKTVAITSRHKKAAKNIGKYRTEAEALVQAEYSESYAKSGHIKETAGWQELVQKNLDKQKLLKVLNEGLEANKPIPDGEGFWPDHPTRHKFMDSGLKILGGYAPEKHVNLNIEERSDEIKALTERLNEIYRSASEPSDGGEPGPVDDQTSDKERDGETDRVQKT